jgi:hypothetical protein
LINQGTSALENLLSGGKKDTAKTKTPKPDIKTQAGNLLNGLFAKKKKQE